MQTQRETSAEAEARAHRSTAEQTIPEIARFLQDTFSQRVAAFIAGVEDPKQVGRWEQSSTHHRSLHRPPPVIPAQQGVPRTHRAGTAGLPAPLRAAEARPRRLRTLLRPALRPSTRLHPLSRPAARSGADAPIGRNPANLLDRLQEAKEQGWLDEVAAIGVSLAAAAQKSPCATSRPGTPPFTSACPTSAAVPDVLMPSSDSGAASHQYRRSKASTRLRSSRARRRNIARHRFEELAGPPRITATGPLRAATAFAPPPPSIRLVDKAPPAHQLLLSFDPSNLGECGRGEATDGRNVVMLPAPERQLGPDAPRLPTKLAGSRKPESRPQQLLPARTQGPGRYFVIFLHRTA